MLMLPIEKAREAWAIPQPNISGTWYIIVVGSQQEGAVLSWLKGWRFPCYCPRQPKSVTGNYNKRRVVMRPMLPGYLFVSFDVAQSAWKSICSFPGVRRILMVDERPLPVPESALEHIRKEEARASADFGTRKRAPMKFKIGAWVQITDAHAFTGFFGRITRLIDDKERIALDIDTHAGGKISVEVSAHQIRVV